MEITKRQYCKETNWVEIEEAKLSLNEIPYHHSWRFLFYKLYENTERTKRIIDKLKEEIKRDSSKLYPKPSFIFYAFYMTSLKKTKVVIIGQDPYFNFEEEISKQKIKQVPQAYGLSFSVPVNFNIPSSLQNIYNNLIKFGHMKDKPEHGCLNYWAKQGCLMLNTSLTVFDGEKNSHSNTWRSFTDEIIKYISDNKEYVVFVLWGADAFKKVNLIDLDKHDIVVSSHPSGLSCHKNLGSHPAFADLDSFGKVNNYLKKHKLIEVDWAIQ